MMKKVAKFGNQPDVKKLAAQCAIHSVRRSADIWWKTLNHETRVKYATEQLNKRGQVFRYNNDGLISGFTLSDVVELFRHYA